MEKHLIQFGGMPVGIAVPDNGKMKFIAVKYHVMDLDNIRFASLADLRRALFDLLSGARRHAA